MEINEEESVQTSRGTYRSYEITDEDDLKERSRELDQDQRTILYIAIKYAKDLVKTRN